MKLLLEITDKDLGIGPAEQIDKEYKLAKSVRSVIFNDKNQIGLEYVRRDGYHKLSGGGMEAGEDFEQTLKREVQEELGVQAIQVGDPIGITIEYRDKYPIVQICYCYFAEVTGAIGETSHDDGEQAALHEPVWMSLDEAIALLEQEKPDAYNGKFIVPRELAFLREAKRLRGDV